jgi:hypothetical protein
MNCGLVTEFVSALCDGESIPHEAAEHISKCKTCRLTLREYSEIGAELRCAASLEPFEATPTVLWERKKRIGHNWLREAAETMRVPRFAVALMIVAILGLSFGLVVLKARAGISGQILFLTLRTSDSFAGGPVQCSVLTDGAKAVPCSLILALNSGTVASSIRISARDGNRFELGVRSKFVSKQAAESDKMLELSVSYPFKNLDSWPEKRFWLELGQNVPIEIAGGETMTLTAALSDQSSFVDARFEPKPDELSVFFPVLLQGNRLVFDIDGATAIADSSKSGCVFMYAPESGRYVLSLSRLGGSVEGRIEQSRIYFEMDGKPYQFVMGAPIADGTHIWILHDPEYRPSLETEGARDDQPFVGAADSRHCG